MESTIVNTDSSPSLHRTSIDRSRATSQETHLVQIVTNNPHVDVTTRCTVLWVKTRKGNFCTLANLGGRQRCSEGRARRGPCLSEQFCRRSSHSRGKLFYRFVQQTVAVEPTPYRLIVADWGY